MVAQNSEKRKLVFEDIVLDPVYEVSVADAAEALEVSEQTVRNWDQNGCPFDPNYPGRFNAIIFNQWAKPFVACRISSAKPKNAQFS